MPDIGRDNFKPNPNPTGKPIGAGEITVTRYKNGKVVSVEVLPAPTAESARDRFAKPKTKEKDSLGRKKNKQITFSKKGGKK